MVWLKGRSVIPIVCYLQLLHAWCGCMLHGVTEEDSDLQHARLNADTKPHRGSRGLHCLVCFPWSSAPHVISLKAKMYRNLTVLIVLACLTLGCAPISGRVKRERSPRMIVAGLRLNSPKTLDVTVAQERLESEGFSCKLVENGTVTTTRYKKQRINNANFVRCRRESPDGVDELALIIDDGMVTEVVFDIDP